MIRMARTQRGCGYRKERGLYLTTDPMLLVPCCKLPHELTVCPTCSQGIKPARGWTWVDAAEIVADKKCSGTPDEKIFCALADENVASYSKTGLLWIGEQFYKTPADWIREVTKLGVSRRVPGIPKGLELGKTLVLVAHRKAVATQCPTCLGAGHCSAEKFPEIAEDYTPINGDNEIVCQHCDGTGVQMRPGIFNAFIPKRVEYVKHFDDDDEKLERLEERGVTIVQEYDPQMKVPGTEAWDDE